MSYTMNLRNRYTGSWFHPYLFGKPYKYTILKGDALIHDFFVCSEELMEWVKKTTYFCGVEGSGKTNLLRFSTWALNQIDFYRKSGIISVLTNDIRILGDPNYSYLFENMATINLMCDDALGGVGTDSTRFMGADAKDVSEKFVQSRHLGKEHSGNPTGIVFMSFATQSYKKLNPVIRENATLKIFTSYMDTKYFQDLFPPEETEFLRETHHNAHVSFDQSARRYAICRTSAGGIATLEIPFVPYSEKVLKWCKKHMIKKIKDETTGKFIDKKLYIEDIITSVPINSKEDFLKQKSHYNKIYIVDRSLTKDKVIDRMANYLRTHPKLKFLIKYHPKRNSLEDFSRGKLKGVLRDETKKIKKEFNVSITISDVRAAIDQALKDEEFELVDKIKRGEYLIEEDDDSDSHKALITRCMKSAKNKRSFHLSEISVRTELSIAQISTVLTNHPDTFESTIHHKGYWHLISRPPNEIEIEQIKEKIGVNEKATKILEF